MQFSPRDRQTQTGLIGHSRPPRTSGARSRGTKLGLLWALFGSLLTFWLSATPTAEKKVPTPTPSPVRPRGVAKPSPPLVRDPVVKKIAPVPTQPLVKSKRTPVASQTKTAVTSTRPPPPRIPLQPTSVAAAAPIKRAILVQKKPHPIRTSVKQRPKQKLSRAVVKRAQPASVPPDPGFVFLKPVKPIIDSAQVRPGRWRYVVLHHSGTPSGNAAIFGYYHKHVSKMENGLAYHFVIGNGHGSGDGEIEVGSRWLRQIQGGHLHSDQLNQISIGICFVGNFEKARPTRKQESAAIELISYLKRICVYKPKLKLHREINPRPTDCPGKNFPGQAFHLLFD